MCQSIIKNIRPSVRPLTGKLLENARAHVTKFCVDFIQSNVSSIPEDQNTFWQHLERN